MAVVRQRMVRPYAVLPSRAVRPHSLSHPASLRVPEGCNCPIAAVGGKGHLIFLYSFLSGPWSLPARHSCLMLHGISGKHRQLSPSPGWRADHGHTTTGPADRGDCATLSRPVGASGRDGLGPPRASHRGDGARGQCGTGGFNGAGTPLSSRTDLLPPPCFIPVIRFIPTSPSCYETPWRSHPRPAGT